MEELKEKKTSNPHARAAAVLLFICAGFGLFNVINNVRALVYADRILSVLRHLLLNLVQTGAVGFLAWELWKQERNKRMVLSVTILAGSKLLSLLLHYERYFRWEYSYYNGYSESFSVLRLLPYLVEMVGYVCLVLFVHVMLNTENKKQQSGVRAVWFLPGTVVLVSLVWQVLNAVLGGVYYGGLLVGLLSVLLGISLLLIMYWVVFPEGSAYHGEGYRSMIPHLLLSLLTLGIYQLIWVCKVTRYLNERVDTEPPMKPWHQVVACLFVPFYTVYWVYKSCQRLDCVAREKGVESHLTMLCVIAQCLSLFNVILASLFMQEKINVLAQLEIGEVLPGAPSVQNGPTWGTLHTHTQQPISES